MKKQNPPETLQSLLKYESKPGQAQRFLARVGKNFMWPSSIPEYLRRRAFIKIADVDLEFEDEVGFNIIFFYNVFDRGEFAGQENEWVTVNNQKVIKYGEEYNDDQLNHVLETMPNAIQLPVDRTRLPRSKPAKMVIAQRTNSGMIIRFEYVRIRGRRPNENIMIVFSYDFYDACAVDTGAPETILLYHVKRILGRRGWSAITMIAGGYGAPAEQIRASMMFEVSIGDDNNRSKWVQARILLWEDYSGDQVECALVGNDVTDQLAYAHEPGNPLKFLDIVDEARLTVVLNGCR
ncbi:11386_t:CDS:2 [Ambispora leptoticha]|uniref:11386_t:CDS:1 n=1 Tax=Ambispora leptoticha TaxID=144679 RepID=A0A9N9H1T0_9GLOM|nr:11386_t:CDS:2 [Ambispora leptoticha]